MANHWQHDPQLGPAPGAHDRAQLGLERTGPENPEVITYKSGKSTLVVYRSQFAGTNEATSATWGLGEEFDATFAPTKLPER